MTGTPGAAGFAETTRGRTSFREEAPPEPSIERRTAPPHRAAPRAREAHARNAAAMRAGAGNRKGAASCRSHTGDSRA